MSESPTPNSAFDYTQGVDYPVRVEVPMPRDLFDRLNPSRAIAVTEVEGCLDTHRGYPVPDLVVEVDRSVNSRGKLAPYFRMGVREAWTWSRPHGASIWLPDTTAHDGMVLAEDSVVMPGVTLEDLDLLLADGSREERFHLSRAMALRVADGRAT